ncbi:MAG: AMP-dependent synthetase/ligase [Desulfococcaceae bacterium]
MAEFRDFRNIHHMLAETAERRGDAAAYRWFTAPGERETVSWNDFYAQARHAARALAALGVQKDDGVVILGYTCYRWVLCDIATAFLGARTVGIFQTLLPPEVAYITSHSDAVTAFAENPAQLDKIKAVRDQLPKLRKVILFSGQTPEGDEDWVLDFDAFLDLAEETADAELDRRIEAVSPDDLAALVYTSGTTGVPKGVMLTHDNMTFTAQSVAGSAVWEQDDEVFLFLPLAHVFARTTVFTAMFVGCPMTFCRGIEHIAEDIKIARPHWFPSVPRIYEKIQAKVAGMAEAKGGAALKLFNWAFAVGHRVGDRKMNGEAIPVLLGLQHKLADKLVLSKVRNALGGRVRWCISGAAPLNPDVGRWFHAAGVLLLEGVGMTENTSFSNLNRYDDYRFGWVGPPGPGVEHKIAEDGEILFRGRNVMKGYHKMPKETEETFTSDGWLRSGDVGEIDDQNFLRITDRKKEIIVTSGGKNISPARVEEALSKSRFINQVLVVGDRRNYLVALVTLEPDAAAEYARRMGLSFSSPDDLVDLPEIVQLVEAEVAERNQELASFETVKKVRIVPEFTIENGILTPTMKIKKRVAVERFAEEIDGMYGG